MRCREHQLRTWGSVALLGIGGVVAFAVSIGVASPVPTTLADFFGPGTQPLTITDQMLSVSRCDSCHAGYDIEHEPYRPWTASMMGQAMRDPLARASFAIANQDASFAGDLCLRCHAPVGWLEGRSTPTDGSALIDKDFEGVNCHTCHRMVDPFDPNNVSPPEDDAILAALTDPPVNPHSGQMVIDPLDRRRGPFDLGSFNNHDWLHSPFHSASSNCGTCHDVSNPAFTAQPDGTYVLNDLDTPHPTHDKYDQFPVERTYSEWLMSAFAVAPIDMGGRFGGNNPLVSTCQDCHMPDGTGRGAQQGALRTNLPRHDMNGGNTWMLQAIRNLFPDNETGLTNASVAGAIARAEQLLADASDMELTQAGSDLSVRVINMTGHKLPSGYPEGRRMWLNVRFFDAGDALIGEHGAYNALTADLTTGDTKVYEARLGVDAAVSGATGVPEGESFHFAINNVWIKDNRIPPMGFDNAAFESVQAAPVAYSYADGQHWDDTEYAISPGAVRAEVRLYYQTASKEYVEFLRDENTTDTWGQTLYDQWDLLGRSPPIEMDFQTLALTTGGCNPADMAEPFGALDFSDVVAFLTAFGSMEPAADLAAPFGSFDFSDVVAFLTAFGAGCP